MSDKDLEMDEEEKERQNADCRGCRLLDLVDKDRIRALARAASSRWEIQKLEAKVKNLEDMVALLNAD